MEFHAHVRNLFRRQGAKRRQLEGGHIRSVVRVEPRAFDPAHITQVRERRGRLKMSDKGCESSPYSRSMGESGGFRAT